MLKQSVILHIPHAASLIPVVIRRTLLLPDDELCRELLRSTDLHTDKLFSGRSVEGVIPVVFPVSRLVVDPERFTDEDREPMAGHGLGAVYLKTLDGKAVRENISPTAREELLQTYYYPHHRRLAAAVAAQLQDFGTCLIIDCHSFPDRPFPFEEDRHTIRPDICIGTDDFHTPDALSDQVSAFFTQAGYKVAFNHPFRGALVPLVYYRINPRVHTLMLEINRKCYMDESTGLMTPAFPVLQQHIASLYTVIRTLL